MYESRFGLQRRPFPSLPDNALYYPATGHESVLATLARGLADDEGFVLCTGAPGLGKSLLAQRLLEQLGDGIESAFLANSHVPNRTGLLQAILFELGQPHEGSEQSLRLRLTEKLLETVDNGKRTILVIDEAQHLSADLLEELRLWGNLEAGAGKAIQVVLLGLPQTLELFQRSELTALRQRVVVRCQLVPLAIEESLDYLMHHLRWAGGQPEKILDESAAEILARGTLGVPRLINQAAHQALSIAAQGDMETVDAEAAMEALALLGLEAAEPEADFEPVNELRLRKAS